MDVGLGILCLFSRALCLSGFSSIRDVPLVAGFRVEHTGNATVVGYITKEGIRNEVAPPSI